MIQGQFYQNSYVTRNLDKAVESFRKHAIIRHESHHGDPVEVNTASGKGIIHCKIAVLWVEDMQYEFIEPVGGTISVYREGLPEDDLPKFHHISLRVQDWAACRAGVDAEPFPILFEGSSDMVKFMYVDTRKLIGHITEYAWMTPEVWAGTGGR